MGSRLVASDVEDAHVISDSRRSFIAKAAAVSGVAVGGPALAPALSHGKSKHRRKNRAEGHSGIHTDTDAVLAMQLTPEDLGPKPAVFADGGGGLGVNYVAGQIPTGKRVPPKFHIRMFSPGGLAFGGETTNPFRIWDESTDPRVPAQIILADRTAGGTTEEMAEIQGDPTGLSKDDVTWEVRHDGDKPFRYNWSTEKVRVVESDLMDTTMHKFPWAMVFSQARASRNAFGVSPYIIEMGLYDGTFDGQKYKWLGSNDRICLETLPLLGPDQFWGGSFVNGIDKKGRAEYGMVLHYSTPGKERQRVGFYAKQLKAGSRSINDWEITISDQVKITRQEYVLREAPFVDTPTQYRMQWEFGGKKLAIQARYGALYEGEPPAWEGKAQSYGTWRELTAGRDFAIQSVWSEMQTVSTERIRSIGGKIVP